MACYIVRKYIFILAYSSDALYEVGQLEAFETFPTFVVSCSLFNFTVFDKFCINPLGKKHAPATLS